MKAENDDAGFFSKRPSSPRELMMGRGCRQPDVHGYFMEYGFPPGFAPGQANVSDEYAGRPLGHDSRPLRITRIL